MGKPTPRDLPSQGALPDEVLYTGTEDTDKDPLYGFTPLDESVLIPAQTYSRNSDNEMPLFKRIGENNLQPYAWVELVSEIGENSRSLTRGYGEREFKPITYAGLKSLEVTNEYSKHPTVELELSDPEYRLKDKQDQKTDLIGRLKVGALINVKFGYYTSHVEWRNMKIVSAEIGFSEGTALLRIKAMSGYKIKDIKSSDVYTKGVGYSALESLFRSMGMEADLSGLDAETRSILRTKQKAYGQDPFIGSSLLNGLDYFISPAEPNVIRIQSSFKYDLIKKGDKPMRLTYGYPVSSIASLEYRKDYPKVGGANSGGALPNKQEVNKGGLGLDVGERTFTSYIRGAFPIKNTDNRFFLIAPPTESQMYEVYPVSQGHSYERDTEFVSSTGEDIFFVKRTVKVKSSTVVEGNPEKIRANRLKSLLLNPANSGVFYEFNPEGFEYLPPDTPNLNFPVNDHTYVEVRKYTFTEAGSQTDSTKRDKPRSTIVTVDAESSEESWQDDFNTLQRIPLGMEDFSSIKDKNSNAYKSHIQIKMLEEKARKNPDKYRLRRGTAEDGATFAVLMELTDNPSGGNKANKEGGSGSTINDAVGGDGLVSRDATPKSSAEKSTASAIAKRAAPKTELTIKFKAGDWSMSVGRVVQIVDVYKNIDGYYYIHKEKHTVGTEGFHTEVICRKARRSELAQYGLGKIKAPRGTSTPKSGERAQVKKAEQLNVITQAESTRRQTVERNRRRQELNHTFTATPKLQGFN